MVVAGCYLVMFALDVAAVIWAGMWFGLTCKKESQAATRTILWVLVAPIGCMLFWCFGFLPFIGWPIFWILWARGKLQSRLREMAAQQYTFSGPSTHWLPGMATLNMPPPPMPQPPRPSMPPIIKP